MEKLWECVNPAQVGSFHFFLSQMVESEENEAHCNECRGKNTDPLQYAGNAEVVEVYEEIGVDQRRVRGRDQNGGVKLQNDCLDQKEDRVANGESDGNEGVILFAVLAFTEQEPVCNVHNGKNDVERKAADSSVCLGITVCRACEDKVKYEEGQKDTKHADKLQYGRGLDVAVLFLSRRPDQTSEHNAEAEEVTDIGKMYVEIPTERGDIIKDTLGCHAAYEAECTIDGLKNELCGSVFDHDHSPF